MEQIIKSLSQSLGLPESTVRAGVGILLNMIKQKTSAAGNSQFGSMIGLLPGAAELMSSTPATAAEPAGGGLGGLLSAAGNLLGGNLGEAAQAVSALQGAGIPMDKAVPLASGFFEQAKSVAGPEAVDAVLAQLPALGSLLGNK
jgi:hypothetical protein